MGPEPVLISHGKHSFSFSSQPFCIASVYQITSEKTFGKLLSTVPNVILSPEKHRATNLKQICGGLHRLTTLNRFQDNMEPWEGADATIQHNKEKQRKVASQVTYAASFIHDFQATGGNFQPDSLFVFALAPCCYRKALTRINKTVAQSEFTGQSRHEKATHFNLVHCVKSDGCSD